MIGQENMSQNSVSVKKKQFHHAEWEKIITRQIFLLFIPIASPTIEMLPLLGYEYSYKLKNNFRQVLTVLDSYCFRYSY